MGLYASYRNHCVPEKIVRKPDKPPKKHEPTGNHAAVASGKDTA
jgi:hypothetical protein